MHALFGAGTVRAISGSGPDAKITVDFAPAVGQKKLVASVANLKTLEAVEGGVPAGPPGEWYEILIALAPPKAGRHPTLEKVHETLMNAVRQHEFWVAVRERLRSLGSVPRVLDQLNGNISMTCGGLLHVIIVIRHGEVVREAEAVLARVMIEILAARHLGSFQPISTEVRVGVEYPLDESNLVFVTDEQSALPDRGPKYPLRLVTPKGVIKSRPKRRDDY